MRKKNLTHLMTGKDEVFNKPEALEYRPLVEPED